MQRRRCSSYENAKSIHSPNIIPPPNFPVTQYVHYYRFPGSWCLCTSRHYQHWPLTQSMGSTHCHTSWNYNHHHFRLQHQTSYHWRRGWRTPLSKLMIFFVCLLVYNTYLIIVCNCMLLTHNVFLFPHRWWIRPWWVRWWAGLEWERIPWLKTLNLWLKWCRYYIK